MDLEEITEEEYRSEGGKKSQIADMADAETIDFSSFVHVDEFKDPVSIKEHNSKAKKEKPVSVKLDNVDGWEVWNLHSCILQGLEDLGFSKPTEIQSNTLSHSILYQKDVIGAAETGSGKTLAFGLPILNHIANSKGDSQIESGEEEIGDMRASDCEEPEARSPSPNIASLILVPTRELAIQVSNHLKEVSKHMKVYITTIMGGMSTHKQERLIEKTPDIVVATPGRLWQLMNEHQEFASKLGSVKFLVLDEADRMLEQGHFRHLDDILGMMSVKRLAEKEQIALKRQTFVFSATMVNDVHNARKHKKQSKKSVADDQNALFDALLDKIEFRNQPVYVNLSKESVTASGVLESKIECSSKQEKDMMLYYLLTRYTGKSIVFVNSIDAIRRLVPIFSKIREGIVGLHAEMQQKQRLKNLERFTSSSDGILISSDVAARGLDIPSVDHVIHYQIPRQLDTYVHRSGRTARANREGVSVMLIAPEDHTQYRKLCHALRKPDGLPDFPVDRGIADRLKQRLQIAKEIDDLEHKSKKQKNEKEWFKKAAEEADIYLSDEDGSDGENAHANKKENHKLQQLKAKLDELLAKPILPKGQSAKYVTMNAAIAVLASKQKGQLVLSRFYSTHSFLLESNGGLESCR
jgi:ATP-dependent RNA helicase DDX24/MAK5